MKKSALVCLALFIVSTPYFGCSLGLDAKSGEKKFYVISLDENGFTQSYTKRPVRVLLHSVSSSPLVSTQRIIFGDDPTTRGYYQFAFWAEPPPQRFSQLLQRKLELAGLFESVATRTSATLADYQINTEIINFYHNIEDRPGRAEVTLRVALVDLSTRNIIASRYFTKSIRASAYNVGGAVKGFTQAVNEILIELVDWLNETI